MPVSFLKIWENMHSSSKDDHPLDDKAMSAIRTGLGIDEEFWDNFLLVINNSSGLSELLDVPVTKISSWHEKVRNALKRVQDADAVPDPKEKGKMLHTGLPKDDEEKDAHTTVLNQV